jgi:translation elongation factor EF-1beta
MIIIFKECKTMIISKKKFEKELEKAKVEAEHITFQGIRNNDLFVNVEKLEGRVRKLELKLEEIASCISGGAK